MTGLLARTSQKTQHQSQSDPKPEGQEKFQVSPTSLGDPPNTWPDLWQIFIKEGNYQRECDACSSCLMFPTQTAFLFFLPRSCQKSMLPSLHNRKLPARGRRSGCQHSFPSMNQLYLFWIDFLQTFLHFVFGFRP